MPKIELVKLLDSPANKFIGTAVKNPNGGKLGDIMDLVLIPENGRIAGICNARA